MSNLKFMLGIKEGEKMNSIKKMILVGLLLSPGNLLCVVNCAELTKLLTKQPFDGFKLYDYVQEIGSEVFSGVNNSSAIDSLLEDNPTIAKLTENTFEPWQNLGDCSAGFVTNVWKHFIDAGQRNLIDNNLKNGESTINLLNNVIVNYSNNLKEPGSVKKLEEAIKDVSAIFNYALGKLPIAIPYPKTPSDLIEAFKADTGVSFEPKLFIQAYKVFKNGTIDKRIFENSFQKILDDNYLSSFNTNILPKGISSAKADCLKVAKLISFFEELIYQSKVYKPKRFWSSKPKDVLTKEQQDLAQEIVDILYSKYPGCETASLLRKVTSANAERYKIPLLIFAQSRILLITLRAYLRKALAKK